MQQTAKVFMTGRSQAVRLPANFRFTVDEVFIRKDAATGDVILSAKPASWDAFFALADRNGEADGFMDDRQDPLPERGSFL
jgi:antitoxin VapB